MSENLSLSVNIPLYVLISITNKVAHIQGFADDLVIVLACKFS